jgi:DNA/RNA-binding domain of Phe-tRNA-synthetase-like protein
MEIHVADAWRTAFPGAVVGVLAMESVANPSESPALRDRLRQIEAEVRSRFGDPAVDLGAHPVLAAYRAHYRKFGKTYHVQGQLESVARKGKAIAGRGALVEAMFAAELVNLVLTAGHDLDAVATPLVVDVSRADDRFVTISGKEQALRPGDMLVRDRAGIISDVVYGPDQRTRLGPGTSRALYVSYAPEGIGADAVRRHLLTIATHVGLIAPAATTASLNLIEAPARSHAPERTRGE